MVQLRRNHSQQRNPQRRRQKHSHVKGRQCPGDIAHQLRYPYGLHRKRLIKAQRLFLYLSLCIPVKLYPPAGSLIQIAVAACPVRDQGDYPAVLLPGSQHCPKGIPVPLPLQFHPAPHNAAGAQQIFQLVIDVLYILRYLRSLHMIKFQYFIYGVFCPYPVVLHGGQNPCSHHSPRYAHQGVLQHLVIAVHPVPDLFVKPSHIHLLLCERMSNRFFISVFISFQSLETSSV